MIMASSAPVTVAVCVTRDFTTLLLGVDWMAWTTKRVALVTRKAAPNHKIGAE